MAIDKHNLTPRQIVAQLDHYIVGQKRAKKMVAVAMRNRFRRQALSEQLRDDVIPKNILMIGPTGVGKTEIARRLAKLADAPFVKVEATKFTEVGYVGRDVESMVRDLVETAIRMVREESMEKTMDVARRRAEDRLQQLLVKEGKVQPGMSASDIDALEIEVETEDDSVPLFDMFGGQGNEQLGNFQEMLGKFMPKKKKKRRLKVVEARKLLEQEEAAKLIDMDDVTQRALRRAEQNGIIFIDEIDKVAGTGRTSGPDVSREGVQRDILPIVEGCTVVTKHGAIKTDYILFIAAGAFHISKPSDLIPELQGRFPVRVELDSLTKEDFIAILTEPQNALTKQYAALLATEGVNIEFSDEAIAELAEIAAEVNRTTENIGARRLHTILEKLLEDLSFEAPDIQLEHFRITPEYVREKLQSIARNKDLSQYIL
jgi:ATP-dependent HslUV protease ATP-binding subunit HslU